MKWRKSATVIAALLLLLLISPASRGFEIKGVEKRGLDLAIPAGKSVHYPPPLKAPLSKRIIIESEPGVGFLSDSEFDRRRYPDRVRTFSRSHLSFP